MNMKTIEEFENLSDSEQYQYTKDFIDDVYKSLISKRDKMKVDEIISKEIIKRGINN